MQYLFLLLFSLGSLSSLTGQQYGHLNFAILISEMPATEAAETELEAYNTELTAKGEQMVTELRARVQEVEAQIEDLPPVRVEELRRELTQEREAIAAYEQQMAIDVQKRRQELLKPIVDEARAAVEAVAEERGYELIFDTSQFNTILYGQDGDDIMPLVKAKLGM